jgi:hypothetical protein
MTVQEFKNEFNIHYNAIASNSAPSIDDYELSVYLTKAQLEIIKNNYNPSGNKYKDGFENSEKRRVDLKELIRDYVSTTKVVSNKHISNDSIFFTIPDDVFITIYESAKIKSNDCYNGNNINVYVKTHDEFNIQINNPFKKPDHDHIWRLDYSKIGITSVAELISLYDLSEYKIRYLKYPKPIIVSNLNTTFPGENLTIDGIVQAQTSELHPSIHREILDRAVELALRDYKPSGLESKIQIDQRNE